MCCVKSHAKELKTSCMNILAVKGQWNIVRGKLKQRLAHLAEDELQFTEGKQEELLGLIQKRKAQEIKGTVPAAETCCTCHQHTK